MNFINKIYQTYAVNKKSLTTFLVTGIGTTILYIGLFSLFWYVLRTNHLTAVSIAFAIAATFQFFTNRKVTFKINNDRVIFQILRYIVLLIINYLISIYVVELTVILFKSPFLGLMLTVIITPITGFLLFKYWVFKNIQPI